MMSDTQRHKQTGNAVTVNVIQHIFEALKNHLIATGQPLQSSGLFF
jgi:site-specific DNA-cytosine methylase